MGGDPTRRQGSNPWGKSARLPQRHRVWQPAPPSVLRRGAVSAASPGCCPPWPWSFWASLLRASVGSTEAT